MIDIVKFIIVVYIFFSSSVIGVIIGFIFIYVNCVNCFGLIRKVSIGIIVIIIIYGVCSIICICLIVVNFKMCVVIVNWINGMKI